MKKSCLYVYTGPETGKKDEAIKAIICSMEKSFGKVEKRVYYATEVAVSEIMTAVQGVSLFEDAVCVIVKTAEVIKKKEDVQMIIDWAKDNEDNRSALILVSEENNIDSKIEKATVNKKIFYEMFEGQKLPYITGLFRQAGYSIGIEAAQEILDMIDSNTAVLKAECSRFFTLFPKGHCVTEDDVEAVLSHDREENAFTLFNAMAGGGDESSRLEKALSILYKIRLSKDNSSVMLIAGLSSCFRRLSLWHTLTSHSDEALLRSKGFISRIAREQYSRAEKIWTLGESEAVLCALCNTDMDIRSGGQAMENVLLDTLLYRIIIKKGAALVEYA